MKEDARKAQNAAMLLELYPSVRVRVAAVIKAMEGVAFRPRIQQAWRSPEEQLAAFRSGHSKLKYGFHNVTGAGGKKESLAVDLIDDDQPLKSRLSYLLRLAFFARAQGLKTGILWGLPQDLARGVNEAIEAQRWDAQVKIGWDPAHLEPSIGAPAQAKAGWRPS